MCGRVRRVIVACPMLTIVLSGVTQSQNLGHHLTRGTVADEFKQPLEQAEVIVRDSMSGVVATALTDSDGTYILHGLDPNTPYHFVVRRIGFVPDSITLMPSQVRGPQAGDTLWVDFMLLTSVPRLHPVNVTANAKTPNIFDKLGNAFDKINSGLNWFDKTLNKYCHKTSGMNGISLCVDPDDISFSFSWKPPIGAGPIGGGIAWVSPGTGSTIPPLALPSQLQGCPPTWAICKDSNYVKFRDQQDSIFNAMTNRH